MKMTTTAEEEAKEEFFASASTGNVGALDWLLSLKIDINAYDENGMTALHRAAVKGHTEAVDFLLISGAKLNQPIENGKSCAIHFALASLETILILLNHGADVNAPIEGGKRPLHLAAMGGDPEIIKALLEHGADFHAEDEDGETVLTIAAKYGFYHLMLELLDRDVSVQESQMALLAAAAEGQLEVLNLLIKCGVPIPSSSSPNQKLVRETTPLHLAVKNDHVDVVRVLLDNDLSVNGRTEDGLTPLHIATFIGNLQMVRLLLENGADVHARMVGNGEQALHVAASSGYRDIVEILIANGAQVHSLARDGSTAMSLASDNDHTATLQVLIKYGKPPIEPNQDFPLLKSFMMRSTNSSSRQVAYAVDPVVD